MNKRKPTYYEYSDIPLRVYFDIVKTKDLRLLSKTGKVDKHLNTRWETILKENEKASNSLWYYNHLNDLLFIKDAAAEYILVRALLGYLHYKTDRKYINELAQLGYDVDTTSDAAFAASLKKNLSTVRNLLNQMQMKNNEMENGAKETKESSFDSIMAQLSMALGFVVPESITLARYNEYTVLIQQRNKAKQQNANTEENG